MGCFNYLFIDYEAQPLQIAQTEPSLLRLMEPTRRTVWTTPPKNLRPQGQAACLMANTDPSCGYGATLASQPCAVDEVLQLTRLQALRARRLLMPLSHVPTGCFAVGAGLCLDSTAAKKKVCFPGMVYLLAWVLAKCPSSLSHHIFGLAVSLQVTVPICLCSKLLTFNGLTGLC